MPPVLCGFVLTSLIDLVSNKSVHLFKSTDIEKKQKTIIIKLTDHLPLTEQAEEELKANIQLNFIQTFIINRFIFPTNTLKQANYTFK